MIFKKLFLRGKRSGKLKGKSIHMPSEDPTLIANKLAELNHINEGWFALPGFHAFTKFDYLQGGAVSFNPMIGFPIKIFMNRATGETRIFPAGIFLQK